MAEEVDKLIGYCGYNCHLCAARSGDIAVRQKLVHAWQKYLGHENYTFEFYPKPGQKGLKMMCNLSRREILRFFAIALPATLFGFKTRDYFDKELVCVHVYDPSQELPEPLLAQFQKSGQRSSDAEYFQIGLPELILCRTEMRLLEMFQYFWPLTSSEVKRLQKLVKIIYKQAVTEDTIKIADLQKILKEQNNFRQSKEENLAVILTLNDYTKYACPDLIEICRTEKINELIIFKDPSRPPYLCSHPSQQKGFKRPPPIGEQSGKFCRGAVMKM